MNRWFVDDEKDVLSTTVKVLINCLKNNFSGDALHNTGVKSKN
jgi:hypothetical protein